MPMFHKFEISITFHSEIQKMKSSDFCEKSHFFEVYTLEIAFLQYYGIIELCEEICTITYPEHLTDLYNSYHITPKILPQKSLPRR